MNIRVDLNYPIKDGTEVVFRSPVDCSQVTGLKVYYNGGAGSQEFAFADAHGNNVGDIDHLFAKDVVVKVILDVTTSMAFVQNADTNAYLEGRFSEIEAAVATCSKQALTELQASGNPIAITDCVSAPVLGLKAYIPANTDGVSTLKVTSCGKNLLDFEGDFQNTTNWVRGKYLCTDDNPNYPNDNIAYKLNVIPGETYTLKCWFVDQTNVPVYTRLVVWNEATSTPYKCFGLTGNSTKIYNDKITFTAEEGCSYAWRVYATTKNAHKDQIAKLSGMSLTLGASVPDEYVPYDGKTHTITLPEVSYGGYVDFVNGKYVQTHDINGTLNTPVAYEVETPEVFTVYPVTNMFTDVENLEVSYVADTPIGKIAEDIYEKVEDINTKIDREITPEMFGAVGDGVADDGAALQKAIDYCVTNDIPLIAGGKYSFSQQLVIINHWTDKTPKIRFDGDLTYTGDNFAFFISGQFISLTLKGHLKCTVGGSIKFFDDLDGKHSTCFNKVEFFTITTQGNGIELYAEAHGVYNNEISGINLGHKSRMYSSELEEDDSCGIKMYMSEANLLGGSNIFVTENTLDIRWIHGYHYGVYCGCGIPTANNLFGKWEFDEKKILQQTEDGSLYDVYFTSNGEEHEGIEFEVSDGAWDLYFASSGISAYWYASDVDPSEHIPLGDYKIIDFGTEGKQITEEEFEFLQRIATFKGSERGARIGDNRILNTSFETNIIAIALINAHAMAYNPRMGELDGRTMWAYYLDDSWSISGVPSVKIFNTKFGEHIVPSSGISINSGYNSFQIHPSADYYWSKGIYIPKGCRQAWAFNLDEQSVSDRLYPANTNYVVSSATCVDKAPADVIPGITNVFSIDKIYKNLIFDANQTGNVVLGRLFYNYYNVNSVAISVRGASTVDRYIYYGDGTLLLTIPKDVSNGTATIKWLSGRSDEAAFTPTVEASWLNA